MHRMRSLVLVAVAAALGACSADAPTVTAPAQPTASASRAARAIPGQYIVVLKEGADPRSVLAVSGIREKHLYTAAIRGFSAGLNQGQLNALRHNPSVAYVQEDREVALETSQSSPVWSLDRVDQRSVTLNSSFIYTQNGTGVNAYIIDSGIRRTHLEFEGRATAGFDAINDGNQDCNGHGTHVAGTVGSRAWGVAKRVNLIAVRVFACGRTTSTSNILAGIDWVTANAVRPAVANLSLGGVPDLATDQAVQGMINAGIISVVAAGNDGIDACQNSPARLAAAITVGATDRNDARSVWNSTQSSNWGGCVDLWAPGSDIISASNLDNTSSRSNGGTSMAAPAVAGAVALFLQSNPTASQATVSSHLTTTSTAGGLTGLGTGSPNRLLYIVCGTQSSGSLSGTGASAIQPGGTWYQTTATGMHRGCLRGPTSSTVDFDLYLDKWNGSSWTAVASSESGTSVEDIIHSGGAGYYRWRVLSYAGSGGYTFQLTRP
jgi:aqualysin 1